MKRNDIILGLAAIAALGGAPALIAQETPPGAEQPADPGRGRRPDDRFEDLIERMERAFGEDFGRLRGLEDLQRQMDEMRREIERLRGRSFRSGASIQGRKIEIGPDGVRVEIEEPDGDGEARTRTYEAESMDAFRGKYPEVAERFFGGGGAPRSRWFRDSDRDGLPDIAVFAEEDLPEEWQEYVKINAEYFEGGEPIRVVPEVAAPPSEGERLGVYLDDLAPAVREFLGVPPGRGILVESVEEGSLAASLGIRPKDVVLTIGDREIAGPPDVRAALREIGKGEKVIVDVNRHGEVVGLSAEKQHDQPQKR